MNTAFDPRRNAANYEVPVPPQEFGQDGGKFYHYYDTFAEEIDDNMVSGLKEQLEGLLIFTYKAGLFAGVNSAFLALTLPLMSPDPADDTNALLRDNNAILLNLALGRNDTLPSPSPLPSETFAPTGKVLTVNVLFSVSLTFAIISSFLAVLGRQWLVYYRKRTGGGPERQRWEQLKRFLGAERWRLEWVLDDFLPSLLQIGLIIFCISLTIYLNTLHRTLSNVVGALMCVGLAILVITAIFGTWDKFCPFQSPLSHAVSPVIPWVICVAFWSAVIFLVLIVDLIRIIVYGLQFLVGIARALRDFCLHGPSNVEPPWEDIEFESKTKEILSDMFDQDFKSPLDELLELLWAEREEDDEKLQIIAIRRAISTSDDAWTQLHAVSNILGITNADLLQQLATDYEFFFRISELCKSSYNRTLQLCGRNRADLAAATCWLYRAAVTHINLSTASSALERFTSDQQDNLSSLNSSFMQYPSLSLGLIDATPIMVAPWLGHIADPNDHYPEGARRLELKLIIDGVVNPSWKCVSMVITVVMMEWNVANRTHQELHAAYTRWAP
ncbi:hypothetical protein FRC01_014392 [Tulasnella sp. 417]|nr:hypothetical protein FRC01_014392 [Tulasnella sp. 417]